MTTKSAYEYFTSEKVKFGWNLGCALDAVNHWEKNSVANETAWGHIITTKALIDGLKQTGFDIIRIPCTWTGHIGSAPDYKICEKRLKRVADVVDMVHNAGMKAIINVMHDGCLMDVKKGTWGFLKFMEVLKGEADNNQIKNQLYKVWYQIADYFNDYGDNLIFETFNEIHSGNWGIEASNEEQDLLFDWNQTALNAIRATGCNNKTRFVAIPGLGSTEPYIVLPAHERGKLLPHDGENGTSKLIVSVHFYTPAQYTVAESTPTQVEDGFYLKHDITIDELEYIDTGAKQLKETFIDNGIAVYYGEWGAPAVRRSGMDQQIKNTHLDYISRVAKAAGKYKILPIYWDGADFSIIDRANGKPIEGFCTEVFNVYKNAVYDIIVECKTPPQQKARQ